jgi:hypothetical protein
MVVVVQSPLSNRASAALWRWFLGLAAVELKINSAATM